MAKVKYYYDSDTLSYRKIEYKKGRKTKIFILSLLGMFLSGFLLLVIYLNIPYIETPKEKALKRELSNMELQFELLNKKMIQAQTVLSEIETRDNSIYRVYFEANPISDEQRKAGFGGVNRYNNLEGFDNSNLIISTSKKLDVLTKQIVVQSKSLDEIARLAEEKEQLLKAIPTIKPVKNEDLTRMASGYGYRSDPFTKARKFHRGMDFTAPRGTPVYATGNGVVKRADRRSSGYGRHIRIDHGFGYISLYAHLYKYVVRRGQKVKRGDLIGFVGSTGRSQAPHLHYEIIKDGKHVNPLNFYYGNLSPEEFAELLKVASQENQSLD
ncbi:MAG: M23 family metallopeptidase [Flavobacteriales bacterium]|jgi:murein DD-endopeptidase MepM/ murein hydrolase activator NlpD|nr:M23 family metallopeptidase [Flavobacteriaceae bacterium]MDG1327766.1 M23 family metallopeptidase [Flavobacteriaceae bacterium]MDG1790666.1 M23 family metallopeptidase [Flavobacteriaceae bacterium]RZP15577.1 MAG: M23 family metallopeptidase [Flavobacteriales bacterium]|tara:strand:+ start:158 stop:1135 length:978 start_codon:yes stop_codon:yes gene_type:complete